MDFQGHPAVHSAVVLQVGYLSRLLPITVLWQRSKLVSFGGHIIRKISNCKEFTTSSTWRRNRLGTAFSRWSEAYWQSQGRI